MSKLIIFTFVVLGLLTMTAMNILIQHVASNFPALILNGLRLTTVFFLVVLAGMFLRIKLKRNFDHFWRYAVISFFSMALPQALLFMSIRSYNTRPIDAGIVEAAIPGIILVYIFASNKKNSFSSILPAVLILVGLCFFLNLNPNHIELSIGLVLLLFSAMSTGVGLILDEKINWPSTKNNNRSLAGYISEPLCKTMYCSLIAGVFTLGICLAVPNFTVQSYQTFNYFLVSRDVLILAVTGVLGWLSIFFLIHMKQLVLVAALIAAVPLTTAIYNYLFLKGNTLKDHEWIGGGILILGFTLLIYFRLVRYKAPPIAC